VRRITTAVSSGALTAIVAMAALPLDSHHLNNHHLAYASAAVIPATSATPTIVSGVTPPPDILGTARAAITGTAVVSATAPVTTTPVVTATPTITATATPTPTRTATPRPTRTATPRPTVAPRATPNPHPGFGAVPWAQGEYYEWNIAGRDITRGTAYQLFTRSGHQWIDTSAYTMTQQQRYALLPSITTFASRTAFDTNTYLLRRYDAVGLRQSNDPDAVPAGSVLRATLFGPHLDYTSYQSWGPLSGSPRQGCTVAKGLLAPARTAAYGMMQDLLRTIAPDATGPVTYTVIDPYGKRPTATASYRILGHETLTTILGKAATVHVRFLEGAQAPLDVWYTTGRGHIVVKWGVPGAFGATLSHYEQSSARTALSVAPPKVTLPAKNLACL